MRKNFHALCAYFMVFMCTATVLQVQNAIAKTYYIAPSGNDGNNGSISSPWHTVKYAWSHSGGGDTVLVRGGTYSEGRDIWLVGGSGGQSKQFWTLKAYPGEDAIFSNGRFIADDAYIRIQGLHLTKTSILQAVRWTDGIHEHIEFIDNIFEGTMSPAMYFIANDGLVQGNKVILTNAGSHGLYIMHGSNNVVRGNYVQGSGKYGIHIYDEEKYDTHAFIKNLLVENNTVVGSETRAGIIISAGESNSLAIDIDGVTVRNNIVMKTAGGGDGITIRLYGKVRNVHIYNNVIYSNADNGISINAEDVDSVDIKNNILCSNGGQQIAVSSKMSALVISNNLYFQPSLAGSGITDGHPLSGDPLFVDAANGNFHLRSNSPAIDAGINVGMPYAGSAPDLGAFEYDQSSSLQLNFFKATPRGESIELQWQLAFVSSFVGFEVEKRTENNEYARIAFIQNSGESETASVYSYSDDQVTAGTAYYRLKILKTDGTFDYSSEIQITFSVPESISLLQNFPNPFNPTTEISYNLPEAAEIDLTVYDILGNHIKTLVHERQSAGLKTVQWTGQDEDDRSVSSGVYIYILIAGGFSGTRKMLLLR
jgi:hypothetical protein